MSETRNNMQDSSNWNRGKFNFLHVALFAVEIALFVNAILLLAANNIGRLGARQIINISFDIFSMAIAMIIFASCILGRKSSSSNSFMLLLFSAYICLFCEMGSWAVDGISGMRNINYAYNIGFNSMMIISAMMFFEFTCKSLNIDALDVRPFRVSIYGVAIAGVAAELLNVKYGFYYYIDKFGVYARNHTGSIAGYIPFIYILGFATFYIIRQKISWKTKIIYLMYILVPLVLSGWYMATEYPPTFIVATFIATVLIYANIYINEGNEATELELENAYKETELALQKNKQMLSQIRPHFIFNALGSIEELCLIDAKKAEEAVHYFSKYLRANMDALGDKDMAPFAEELDHLHNYVWLEKMRFEDEFEYSEEIGLSDFEVPTLSIQPLIENAIKHGMMGTEEGVLHVKLISRQRDGQVEIIVSDDGCGFDTSIKKEDGRSHVGMSYVRNSIEKRLGGSMNIDSKIGEGTVITLRFPL